MCKIWRGILEEYVMCLFTCNVLLLENAVVMQTAFWINAAERVSFQCPSNTHHNTVIKSDKMCVPISYLDFFSLLQKAVDMLLDNEDKISVSMTSSWYGDPVLLAFFILLSVMWMWCSQRFANLLVFTCFLADWQSCWRARKQTWTTACGKDFYILLVSLWAG